jgi:cellulose synthase/poly-beta-1,6-N-acetylglucosamine synthase-like glycosyltransferase/spore germination protein YaaH/peptidoglycan/xylan/chitin deacetylase (PgdA/CDA1 family)
MSAKVKRELPVFFDPDNKRWPRLKRGVYFSGLLMTIAFGILILSIIINPTLPKLNLPGSSFLPNGSHAVALTPELPKYERELSETKRKLNKEIAKHNKSSKVPILPPRNEGDPLSVGFYVNWDESSLTSLKDNIQRRGIQLDLVICEALHLRDGVTDSLDEEQPYKSIRVDDPFKMPSTLAYLRERSPHTKAMALINNAENAQFHADRIKRMLASAELRKLTIEEVYQYITTNQFAGVSIDFEEIPNDSRANFVQFMNELAAKFKPAGLEISVNVPADDEAYDYRKLSEAADYVIVMAYDEHDSAAGQDGPIASMEWFADILKMRQMDIPAEKTIIALGNYGYDWAVEDKNGKKVLQDGTTQTFEDAMLIAKESSYPEADNSTPEDVVEVKLDPESLNPYYEYADNDDTVHRVWFLDAVTAFNQMSVARNYAPRGYALWRLGSEDPSLWDFFGNHEKLTKETADNLANITYGYNLDYEGQGEMLEITSYPKNGERSISFDEKRNLVAEEEYTQFPSPFVIKRYGSQKNQIALTFDDGPDPRYTPKILDILKEHNAKATFFFIGLNGELYPELLKREFDEGHDIGSHSFTHPNAATITDTQFSLELSANDVLLESAIGHRTTLFRPPFAQDVEPTTPAETHTLDFTNQRGYINVGILIDPNDWNQPAVTTDEIIKQTVDQAKEKARTGDANVVLLHDSGGDRSRTIEALPVLIDKLREEGFELVTVSELLNKPREEIMPPVPVEGQWRMFPVRWAFKTITFAAFALRYLFLIGIVLGILRLVFMGILAIIEHWRERKATYDPNYKPTVAVIVPAYNEEKVIIQTISSLLASDLPGFEIVVVDDGSTDNTAQKVREAFEDEPRVRLFVKPNGGKPEALNYGVRHTDSEIVIALDADTVFAEDTISKLVRHFVDPKIGAVAGNAKVGNRINLLTRWQALEYITSQNLDRRAFNTLDCITVVPGAVGAWRRDLVLEAGGFTHDTLAEDADLTMAIRKQGYRVAYEDEAIGLTEAPDTVSGFVKQRYRWMYGTLQAAWKHKGALFNPRYGSLGFIALPNIFIFQVFFPLVSPVMDLLMVWSMGMTLWNRIQHPAEFSSDTLMRVLFFYALFLLIDFMAAALAFTLEMKENKRLLVWLFLQRFFYRQLMYYVAIKSTFASLKGIAVGWNKLERKATVKT